MKIDEIFNPSKSVSVGSLAESLDTFINQEQSKPEVKAKIATQIANSPLVKLLSSDIPLPLSYEEALAVDDEIAEVQTSITAARTKVANTIKAIDAIGYGDKELSFSIDITKRAQLKKAIKSVFKVDTDTITYSMYKAALEAKRNLEESESDSYVNVKWKK